MVLGLRAMFCSPGCRQAPCFPPASVALGRSPQSVGMGGGGPEVREVSAACLRLRCWDAGCSQPRSSAPRSILPALRAVGGATSGQLAVSLLTAL